MISREHLKALHQKEMERFISRTPKSATLFEKAKEVMPGGVPMSWMSKWPGKYPLFVESATAGPGLLVCLMVGLSAGKSIAGILKKPFLARFS